MHIQIKKGLDIPLLGERQTEVQDFLKPKQVALDFSPFFRMRFSLKVREGDHVACGQPLAEDKACTGRLFLAPAGGTVTAIERGEKRRLLKIVIDVAEEEESLSLSPIELTEEAIIARMLEGGMFGRIFKRPCGVLANPEALPSSIFVQAIESAPYSPPFQVDQSLFARGLEALTKLATVHVVSRAPLKTVKDVHFHTASGPHPIASPSVHIYHIDPILKVDEVKWTVHARDVAFLGGLVDGQLNFERIVNVAGEGIPEEKRGLCRVREGMALEELTSMLGDEWAVVSGDPLMGQRAKYLGLFDSVVCAIEEASGRQLLHFCRPGLKRYTASMAYLSSFLGKKKVALDTNLHGETRAFVDSGYYDKFMPMKIPTVPLVKAILAADFDMAVDLGLLEVDPSDFAIPTFVCPSKIEMVEIVRSGLLDFADQYV